MELEAINFRIGAKYKYFNSNKLFILESTNETKTVFYFSCGHWCTDNVFIDLFDIATGIQVSDDVQISLEF